MRLRSFFIAFTLFVSSLSATAEGFGTIEGLPQSNFLEPQDAFKAAAKVEDDTLKTAIILGDKIHAYVNKLKYTITKPKTVELEFTKPKAVQIEGDPDPVFYGTQTIDIPLGQIRAQGIESGFTLTIQMEGCSDAGICYNPQTRTFELNMPPKNQLSEEDAAEQQQLKELAEEEALENLAESSTVNTQEWQQQKEIETSIDPKSIDLPTDEGLFGKIARLTREGNTARIAEVLTKESSFFILFLFFIFGLLLALTPCIFPMIPILSSIIVSQAGKGEEVSTGKAFFTSLVYVLAMALTYTIVGVAAGLLGADIQAAFAKPWVIVLFALVFIALAFSLFGYYEIGLPASWQSKLTRVSDNAQGKGGMLGTAVMGALSALIVGPCVAPPLGGAILFISQSGDAWLGGWALFIMSIGMGMPLLLVGLGAGKFMPRPGGWMTRVSEVFGVLMLVMALYMLRSLISDGMMMLLSALLLMGTALYMNPFETSSTKGAFRLIKLFALSLLLYGALLFVGWVSGSTSLFNPLDHLGGAQTATAHKPIDRAARQGWSYAKLFEEVQAANKPVIVDIGKANCASCTELEEITFTDPAVQAAMKRFHFIQIDITKHTTDDDDLLKQFHIFGAPNLLFFDGEGKPLPKKFLTGFVKPEKLVEHLKGIQ
jgi:thiol:disulfide interchange protein DsbD